MKDDRAFLLHIRDAAAQIVEYAAGHAASFYADRRTQDAVIRNLEIIGEAAKNLSEATKARSPTIPWRLITGMRDKLIHNYFGVNLDLVWQTVEREIPRLQKAVNELLEGS